MFSIPIDDVTVSFPFSPYPAQVEYMRAVIMALNNGFNALLESPTGTGKTLCLLCATLAWLENKRKNNYLDGISKMIGGVTRVIYCSRTHAQLSQVIRELKRTSYGNLFSMCILGSREHMCVNSQVVQLPTSQAQQSLCNTLREEKNCRFYRGFQARGNNNLNIKNDAWIHDLEDLVTEGKKSGFCPYYQERDLAKESDIVFLPYNYVLDLSLRKQLPFELKGSILIADEAHNLPSFLGESCCINLQPLELTNAIHDCSRAVAMQKLMRESGALDDDAQDGLMEEQELASLKIILCKLESCIAEVKEEADEEDVNNETKQKEKKLTKQNSKKIVGNFVSNVIEIVREGKYIIPFLEKSLITRDLFFGDNHNSGGLNDLITKVISLLSQSEGAASGLSKVQKFLSFVFERCEEGNNEACHFVIQGSKNSDNNSSKRSLGYWCLDTSTIIQSITSGLHSFILTSGTLSPIDHFAAELGIPFDVCLKGSHVIQSNQVIGCVLCKGPGGEKLNGSYAFRNSIDYRIGLGISLVNISCNTPGGVLVFFPSYVALNSAVELWRTGSGRPNDTKTIWGMLEELKPVFVEPAEASNLSTIVSNFQKEVDNTPSRGAILLAVCRGKISEGIDFADNHGRCVIVAGIPFANHTDLFVRLKRDYITRIAPQRPRVGGKLFTGDDWYINEAMRTVNQCVGRVIRHKDDYGAIIFADERFSDRLNGLPSWIATRCTVHREFRETYSCIAQFFATFRRRVGGGFRPYISTYNNNNNNNNTCADSNNNNNNNNNNIEKVPDSAEMARIYAEKQMRQVAEEKEAQRRRCLVEAKEIPTITIIKDDDNDDEKEKETKELNSSTNLIGGEKGINTTSSMRPSFKRQVLPNILIPESTPIVTITSSNSLIGSSSKEFCQFLKQRLQPISYDRFRDKLKQIANIRNTPGISPDDMKKLFSNAIDGVTEIFREAASERENELLQAFGEHIPEEFRPYYLHLLRKRRRPS